MLSHEMLDGLGRERGRRRCIEAGERAARRFPLPNTTYLGLALPARHARRRNAAPLLGIVAAGLAFPPAALPGRRVAGWLRLRLRVRRRGVVLHGRSASFSGDARCGGDGGARASTALGSARRRAARSSLLDLAPSPPLYRGRCMAAKGRPPISTPWPSCCDPRRRPAPPRPIATYRPASDLLPFGPYRALALTRRMRS